MYRHILFASLALVIFSCSTPEKPEDKIIINRIAAEIAEEDTYDYDTLSGMYIGDFAGSDIRIRLNYLSKKNAIGYNNHKGLQRNLTGKVAREGEKVNVVLAEPGDHEYDGVFTIIFDGTNNNHTPKASWSSNSGKISPKEFKLKKLIAPEESNRDELTIHNFADIFDYCTDSIGSYVFEEDGIVTLEYYEDEADEENRDANQMLRLSGTWSLDGMNVLIQWQKNDIFPNNELRLTAVKDEYEWWLEGKGKHRLWMMYY